MAEQAVEKGWTVGVECFDGQMAVSEQRRQVLVRRHRAASVVASQPLSWAYLKAAFNAMRRGGIVHLHAPNLLAALGVVVAPRRRAILVVHWHSDIVSKGWLGFIARPLEWLMLLRSDAVIATTPNYVEGSHWLRRFRQKVHVVPLGLRDVQPPPNSATRRDPMLVLAVGRLVPYKGFDVLLRAARDLLPGARVALVGVGPLSESLRSLATQPGIAGRVELLGRLSHDELAALYNRASVFCLPSVERSEAFGVVLLEAMRAGIPVVATDIEGSGVTWVNQHGQTGLNVPVGDPAALAAACNLLLSDDGLRMRLGSQARERFEHTFTAQASAAPLMRLYSELLSSHGLRKPCPSTAERE